MYAAHQLLLRRRLIRLAQLRGACTQPVAVARGPLRAARGPSPPRVRAAGGVVTSYVDRGAAEHLRSCYARLRLTRPMSQAVQVRYAPPRLRARRPC